MKFIISTTGTAAIRVSGDDVIPQKGVLSRDLIEFITKEYQFAVFPNIPPGIAPFMVTTHVYQSGVYVDDGVERFDRIPIIQFCVVPNGDLVSAGSTDVAEKILDNLTNRLDENLGYRFSSATARKIYHSVVVVQFEPGLEERIKAISAIDNILNRNIPRPRMPFGIKRLAFGHGEVTPFLIPTSLEASLLDRLRRGLPAASHLDQRDEVRRVEGVAEDDTGRVADCVLDVGDKDARRRGRDDHVLAHGGRDLGKIRFEPSVPERWPAMRCAGAPGRGSPVRT